MNDIFEQRDRLLTHELNQTLEKKRLEIAAAQEKEKRKVSFLDYLESRKGQLKNELSFFIYISINYT